MSMPDIPYQDAEALASYDRLAENGPEDPGDDWPETLARHVDRDEWPHCGKLIRDADGETVECVIAANHDGDHEDGEGRAFTDDDAERSHRPPGWRDEP